MSEGPQQPQVRRSIKLPHLWPLSDSCELQYGTSPMCICCFSALKISWNDKYHVICWCWLAMLTIIMDLPILLFWHTNGTLSTYMLCCSKLRIATFIINGTHRKRSCIRQRPLNTSLQPAALCWTASRPPLQVLHPGSSSAVSCFGDWHLHTWSSAATVLSLCVVFLTSLQLQTVLSLDATSANDTSSGEAWSSVMCPFCPRYVLF